MSTTDIGDPPSAWVTLADGGPPRGPAELSTRRVVLRVVAAALAVLLGVGLLGVIVVRRVAEREAMNGASQMTDLLARTVIMPALSDDLITGQPAARARMEEVIRSRVLTDMFVRVKIWAPDGTVLYADEPELIGRQFTLGEEQREVLAHPATVAQVSDLRLDENLFERGQGRLVEVYGPIWTPSGQPLLFETYTRYSAVTERSSGLWRAFSGIVLSSLMLFGVLLAPLLWTLLDRLRRARDQRERLLHHALDASETERRRIAADLHDGVVQELVAASLLVGGTAERTARDHGEQEAAPLRGAALAVRSGVRSLRTLLVDIYPDSLASAGLAATVEDLAAELRTRGTAVTVEIDPAASARLDDEQTRLVYRTARECLRNIAQHARADHAWVRLRRGGRGVVLDVVDDGAGLPPEVAATLHREGHLGLRLLADLATDRGAALRLATAPGSGTWWQLEIGETT